MTTDINIIVDESANKKIFLKTPIPRVPLRVYAKLIAYFEAHRQHPDCEFDSNNTCFKYRADAVCYDMQKITKYKVGDITVGCCCSLCYPQRGYLYGGFSDIYAAYIPEYVKHFAKDFGFWRPGTGCTLPRHVRSITCLKFVCNRKQSQLTKQQKQLIAAIGHIDDFRYFYNKPHLFGYSIEEAFKLFAAGF
jgi:hypothetical protein